MQKAHQISTLHSLRSHWPHRGWVCNAFMRQERKKCTKVILFKIDISSFVFIRSARFTPAAHRNPLQATYCDHWHVISLNDIYSKRIILYQPWIYIRNSFYSIFVLERFYNSFSSPPSPPPSASSLLSTLISLRCCCVSHVTQAIRVLKCLCVCVLLCGILNIYGWCEAPSTMMCSIGCLSWLSSES